MSDPIHHECGIALIRMLKKPSYFQDQLGDALWGFRKLLLLMEKQHNRGQDGVGIGCCKLGVERGQPYLFRARSNETDSLARIFRNQMDELEQLMGRGVVRRLPPRRGEKEGAPEPGDLHRSFDFGGEILMGHLRYGTSGAFSRLACHPYLRRSNWRTKSLMVMGNFNMTNTGELNRLMIDRGQHPVYETDTQTVLEEIGFHLDEEHTELYREQRELGMRGRDIPDYISRKLDPAKVIRASAEAWDGGYTIAGVIGNGDTFVLRDPKGIRPCFYYAGEDVVAFASERVPLMTAFELETDEVTELEAGTVAVIKSDGTMTVSRFADPEPLTACSFERIYFSRGNDPDIYRERKALGKALVPQVLKAIGGDLANTVFSFVPNTAEVAYHGLMEGLRLHRREEVRNLLLEAVRENRVDEKLVDELIMGNWPRGEKIAHKDIKLRTFIAQEDGRAKLASHVYDITYDVVTPQDNLVVIDDSIVRGTTLRESILYILSRTRPKKIIIASTAPQVRYPDCYGIDMSELGKFIAFQAAAALYGLERHRVFEQIRHEAEEELAKRGGGEVMENVVRKVYAPFCAEMISRKIAELVRPEKIPWKGEIEIIYQGIENLHAAIPGHSGDWYFTGDYPTKGGVAIANAAFLAYMDRSDSRPGDNFLLPGLG